MVKDHLLVLYNNKADVRVMTRYPVSDGLCIPPFHHLNLIDIYELYHFKDKLFVISEYIGHSLKDLLEYPICLVEPEIAFIISRVRWASSYVQSYANCSRY